MAGAYCSSLSFSKRYSKLKKNNEDTEEDEGKAFYSLSSFQMCEEYNDAFELPIQVIQSSKKKQSVNAVSRFGLMFSKQQRTSFTSGLGTRFVCTLFGYRHGRANFAFQDPKSYSAFFFELPTPTSSLIREMASGVVRIALECDKVEKKGVKLLQESLWRTYCNGKKCGIAIRQEVGPEELKVLKAVGPISTGAGVLAGSGSESEGELMYMRAKFERVVVSKQSEAFYMMNPCSTGGPELSVYLSRV